MSHKEHMVMANEVADACNFILTLSPVQMRRRLLDVAVRLIEAKYGLCNNGVADAIEALRLRGEEAPKS